MIVSTTLSNNRVGIAVILDAANVATTHVDPEVTEYVLSIVFFSPNIIFCGGIKYLYCGSGNDVHVLWLRLTIFVFISDHSACVKCVSQSCLSSTFNQQ